MREEGEGNEGEMELEGREKRKWEGRKSKGEIVGSHCRHQCAEFNQIALLKARTHLGLSNQLLEEQLAAMIYSVSAK